MVVHLPAQLFRCGSQSPPVGRARHRHRALSASLVDDRFGVYTRHLRQNCEKVGANRTILLTDLLGSRVYRFVTRTRQCE